MQRQNVRRTQSHPALTRKKHPINHLVVMGDSISDRGTMNKRHLLGLIPMHLILAMTAHNHDGRFTNGYTWDDDLGAMMASGFLAQHFKKKHKKILDDTDLADAIITKDRAVEEEIKESYNLDSDRSINFKDLGFVRTYCEGGLTSADYSKQHIANIPLEASRHMLSTLSKQREKVIADDKVNQTSRTAKFKTLVIEWSGGNDLITVNKKPTKAEADIAVAARIENVKKMLEQGYRKFALFMLPDLSLTPRFKRKDEAERNEAKAVCDYFNEELARQCKDLEMEYPGLEVDVFDVNKTLNKVIDHPQAYGFDPAKVSSPFIESDEYKAEKGGTLSAPDYIFWDDIHPSAHTHALLAKEFYQGYAEKYQFVAPEVNVNLAQSTAALMYDKFMKLYELELANDKNGLFGFFRKTRLKPDLVILAKTIALDSTDDSYTRYLAKIFNHALNGGGKRTKAILKALGWIDVKGIINANIDELEGVKTMLEAGPQDNPNHRR